MEQRTVVVNRDCPARLVPAGTPITIKQDTFVNISQALGGTYTVTVNGNMARIDATDADALGFEPMVLEYAPNDDKVVNQDDVQHALETIYDPEIPVSIVALGLIYDCQVVNTDGKQVVQVTMTLTAPNCGMGMVLVDDIKYRVAKVPHVDDVKVELVFDPPWDKDMISEEARLELGIFFD